MILMQKKPCVKIKFDFPNVFVYSYKVRVFNFIRNISVTSISPIHGTCIWVGGFIFSFIIPSIKGVFA